MISYFKYTSGDAFELNGVPYYGFFNITNGEAYTERVKGPTSELLSPLNTFLSDFYLNKMEFDNQYENISDIQYVNANVFDVINKVELERLLKTINNNNLIVFKSLVINNPQIINFTANDSHYYGLSATPVDIRVDDIISSKKDASHIDPFSYSEDWKFLESVKYGALFVLANQSFKYLCTTGTDLITVVGSFENGGIIDYTTQNLPIPQEVYGIDYDEFENKISIIINDKIYIYDSINYIECGTLVLVDTIKLGDIESEILTWGTKKDFSKVIGKFGRKFYNINKNATEYMRFGGNYRTSIEGDKIVFWNKYSSDKIKELNLSSLGVDTVLNLDIRRFDDHVVMIYLKNKDFYVCHFDALDLTTLKNYKIEGFGGGENVRISFSTYDSNVFYLNSEKECQTRLISNPTYPVGRMRENNLKYPQRKPFEKYYQKWGNGVLKWNSERKESNNYNNIFFDSITKSNNNYIFMLNVGRLYPLKQNIDNAYLTSISKDLQKYYNGVRCADNSFGLFFNKTMTYILKDILNLYTKATNSYSLSKDDIILSRIKEIDYDINNLYINGNETINVLTLQRILTLIIDIQKNLLANLTSSDK